jgi:putative hydrolase of the HAD superfamily
MRKPSPAIYAEAFARLGITAGDAVFVGDNPVADYAGPVAMGMRAFLVDPAARHAAVPAAHRIDSVFALPSALAV